MNLKLKRYRERPLSEFFAQNLISEIDRSDISKETSESLNLMLRESPELRKVLNQETAGLNYFRSLREIGMTDSAIQDFQTLPGTLSDWSIKLQPSGFTESQKTIFEIAIVSIIIGVALLLIPWDTLSRWALQLQSPQVTLAEIAVDRESSEDQKQEPLEPVSLAGATAEIPKGKVEAPPIAHAREAQLSEKEKFELKAITETEGKLYRASLESADVDHLNPLIIEGMKKLGAMKAGEVELGWQRVQGTYFHFLLPKNKKDELVALFKANGLSLQFREENHPRKIPANQMRVIINLNYKRERL